MKIYREVLHEVLDSMPVVPPEAGGIIGGKDGKVCIWAYDAGCFEKGCAYWPDVDFLNSVLRLRHRLRHKDRGRLRQEQDRDIHRHHSRRRRRGYRMHPRT